MRCVARPVHSSSLSASGSRVPSHPLTADRDPAPIGIDQGKGQQRQQSALHFSFHRLCRFSVAEHRAGTRIDSGLGALAIRIRGLVGDRTALEGELAAFAAAYLRQD